MGTVFPYAGDTLGVECGKIGRCPLSNTCNMSFTGREKKIVGPLKSVKAGFNCKIVDMITDLSISSCFLRLKIEACMQLDIVECETVV